MSFKKNPLNKANKVSVLVDNYEKRVFSIIKDKDSIKQNEESLY